MLDKEIGFTGGVFRTRSLASVLDVDDDVVMDEEEEESQFSISKTLRRTSSLVPVPETEVSRTSFPTILSSESKLMPFFHQIPSVHPSRRLSTFRKSEDYAKYISEETSINRRSTAAGAGASVVSGSRSSIGPGGAIRSSSMSSNKGGMKPPPLRQGSGSSASILGSRTDKFA
jgi:hypothetical protein